MFVSKICVPRHPFLIEGCVNNDVIVVQDPFLHVVKLIGRRGNWSRSSSAEDRNGFCFGTIKSFLIEAGFAIDLGNLGYPEIKMIKN
jgi:hypothetical protein